MRKVAAIANTFKTWVKMTTTTTIATGNHSERNRANVTDEEEEEKVSVNGCTIKL